MPGRRPAGVQHQDVADAQGRPGLPGARRGALRDRVYVAASGSNAVTVIDGKTDEPIGPPIDVS
ncbi:hypothetical protein ACWEGQ_33715, partial [Streptomyces seoulensis]